MGWFSGKADHKRDVDAVLNCTAVLYEKLAGVHGQTSKLCLSLPDSRFRCMMFSLVTVYTTIYGKLHKPESVLMESCVSVTCHGLQSPIVFFGKETKQQESVLKGQEYSQFFLNQWSNHISAGRYSTATGRAMVATMLRYIESTVTPVSSDLIRLTALAADIEGITRNIESQFILQTI